MPIYHIAITRLFLPSDLSFAMDLSCSESNFAIILSFLSRSLSIFFFNLGHPIGFKIELSSLNMKLKFVILVIIMSPIYELLSNCCLGCFAISLIDCS
jgi:hypothetical protein